MSISSPGDLVRGERNPNYHEANRPYFDTIEMKGGGDAVSAARAVIQTGEYDFAWNMQVEDEILKRLEESPAQGPRRRSFATGSIEHIQLNNTDPWTEVDGERSSIKTKHPLFSDPAVREALSLLVDRASVQKYIYGRTGIATGNFINDPQRFVSKNTKWEFNIAKANRHPGQGRLEARLRRRPRKGRHEAALRSIRPRSTRRARRTRRSSSRPARRPASRWS